MKVEEWSRKTKYNSFNSDKGLTYYEHYQKILSWLDGKGQLPAPIECNLDPIAECNLSCYFCIGQRYLRANRDEVGEMRKLPTDYMLKLVDFLVEWGVKGLCLSGGGEPTLHEGISRLVDYSKNKVDVAIVTNATNLFDGLLNCRWVALSVDAAKPETYTKIKGKPYFDKVCSNISNLAKRRNINRARVDLCFKFLIMPENQYEIYDACKLAKELGVQDFHARPVDFERQDIVGHKKLTLDIGAIHKQFEKCHELETDNFHVYTITHKFNSDFHVKFDYSACLAAPILLPVLTDGNAYLCVEHKMEEKYRIGSAFPNPESILGWWGNDKHRDMIKSIVPERDCSRCIYSEYHKQMEFIKTDSMCRSFP